MTRLVLALLVLLAGAGLGHADYPYTLSTKLTQAGKVYDFRGYGYLVLVAYDPTPSEPEPPLALEPVFWAATLTDASRYVKTELRQGRIHHAYILATVGYGERALTEAGARR